MTTQAAQSTQVYEVSIKASPEQIWEAITQPEWTKQYFHGARITVVPDHYTSLGPDGDTWGDAGVDEFDPPRRLVHGWRSLYDPELATEDESRVTWEIEPQADGACLLRVTHDRLEGAPKTAAGVSGGWQSIIENLKALLETGKVSEGARAEGGRPGRARRALHGRGDGVECAGRARLVHPGRVPRSVAEVRGTE